MTTEKRLIDANALKALFDERYDDAFIQMYARLNKEYWDGVCGGVNWGRNTIAGAPTVDAVEVPDKELLRAIKLLIKQYEHSKNSEYVHSPVAHALFHTWRQVEERRTDP